MATKEDFDILVQNAGLGCRMRLEEYSAEVQNGYAGWKAAIDDLISCATRSVPRMPPINFDFVFNGRVNVFAAFEKGEFFMGVTTGATYMLQTVFLRMLADRRLFPKIGSPNRERDDLPLLPNFFDDADLMHYNYESRCVPQDPLRGRYALHLFDQALWFLIGHEIAHISLGHCGYHASQFHGAQLVELGWTPDSVEKKLERQTLEMIADSRSAFSRVSSVIHTAEIENGKEWQWKPGKVEGWDDLLFETAFAVHTLFRIFGEESFNKVHVDQNPYPPVALRRMMLDCGFLYAVQRLHKSGKLERARSIIATARKNADLCIAHILGVPANLEDLETAYTEEGGAHFHKLQCVWNYELKDKVTPYAFEFGP